jgi:DNA replication protein DnaC
LFASRLVIDDLGEEFNDTKGNFLAVLDEAVSDRIANLRPTVITTNLDVEAFKLRYGARVTDRIRGSGRWFAVAGESMRGRAEAAE